MDGCFFGKMKFVLAVFAVFCLVLSAGCTGSGDTAQPQQQAQPTQQQVAGGEQAPSGGAQASSEVVHNSILKEYLPTATGNWESGEASGFQMDSGDFAWSWASNTYEQKLGGEAVVTVVIQDTAGEDVGYMATWDAFIEMDTPDLSYKTTKVQGFPAWVATDKNENIISQTVNVGDRFLVFTSVEDGKEDYLTVFNTQTDLAGLSKLA